MLIFFYSIRNYSMPKMLHTNENPMSNVSKSLDSNDVLLARIARLIHKELLSELQKNRINDIKPGSTSVIAVGNQLLFATENHIGNDIIQKMKKIIDC
jgi:hypothetical protein